MIARLPFVIFFLLAHQAGAVVERAIERTFAISGRATVVVDTFFGDVQVKVGADSEVRVHVTQTLEAKDDAEAERLLRLVDWTIGQTTSGSVNIRANYRRSVRWSWEKWPPFGVALELTVPRDCDLTLTSREGGVRVGDLRGNITVRAAQGTVFLGEVDGTVKVMAERGDVSVVACTGELTLTTQSGNVLVGRASGPTRAATADGALDIKQVTGELTAQGEGGEVRVGFGYPFTAGADVKAEDGELVATFDPRSAATLDVNAGAFGKVLSRDLTLTTTTGAEGASKLTGTLNGGGARIRLRGNSSGVRLRGVPAGP